VGLIKREWLVRAIVPIPLTIVAWQLADFFQRHYHRARPAHWFVKHEHAFSYPSSHAAIAIAFYALWGVMLWRSELPARTRAVGAACLAVLTIGIIWSRLALGAHYVTDVLGGALLAAGVTLLALGLLAAFGISLWPRGARALKVRIDPELP
jgi:undecaprenyl-diphosphatase